MSKIDRILIGCNKNDLHLTKICVASIRYWCPDIPILLIKDELNGAFDTKLLEDSWNIGLYASPIKKLGWGIGTLIPFITDTGKRCLYLDADTLLLGDIISHLQDLNEDVIVSLEKPDDILESMENAFFSLDNIRRYDAHYQKPNYLFNTGHLVINEGILTKEMFAKYIDWDISPPTIKDKETFKCADQSLLNFILPKMEKAGKLKIAKSHFNIWGFDYKAMDFVSLEDIKIKKSNPKLIHWAGIKTATISGMTRTDILAFYEDIYYSKIRLGSLKKHYSHFIQHKKEYVLTFKKALVWVRDNVLKS
jgi:lipopolysaccharide biosynthesis glycosyltransferase